MQVNLGKVMGATGEVGATGPAGEKGADGLTPYIASNGNWWLGTTDTGVSASGSQWLYGSEVPTSQGVNGDLYLINSGDNIGNVYKKLDGAWTLITNIKGPAGEKGEKGDSALTFRVGAVSTALSSGLASVTNVGSGTEVVLDFVLPKGEAGEKGEKGDRGNTVVYIGGIEATSIGFSSDPQAQIDSKLNKFMGVENAGKYLVVNSDGNIEVTSFSPEEEVIEAYIVGTEKDAGWLSLTEGGLPLSVQTGKIYIIKTEGEYLYSQFIWDGDSYQLSGAGSSYLDEKISSSILSSWEASY